jgi:outer membrane protein assembly factor BamB
MESSWKQAMIYTDVLGPTVQRLGLAERLLLARGRPVLPAFFPVTSTVAWPDRTIPLVIFKDYWGVQAVNVKTGKLEWNSPSNWSLERTIGRGMDARKSQVLNSWLQFYIDQNQRPQVLFENSVCGTLATDNQYVYAVEDLAVPPPQFGLNTDPRFNAGVVGAGLSGEIGEAVRHSRLQAFSLTRNGKLMWEAGGLDGKTELSDSFFLGPPLPLAGLLYVVTQKDKDLRLACLDPRVQGKVVWVTALARTGDTLAANPLRRTQAVQLAYADGTLVVPTNAGAVLSVHLADGSLAWAFPYRGIAAAVPPVPWRVGRGLPHGWAWGPDGRPVPTAATPQFWQVTAPAVVDGKVVFAAPDGDAVHCLDLRDGTPLWTAKRRDDDLYFAGVYGGKALVVGKKKCRALSLARGEPVWELETGLPSGQGVAAGGVYYLPLREGAQTREPEICAIDVGRGLVVSHTRSRNKGVPGNLLFYEGHVISQTPFEVVAYPQLAVALGQINERLARNPNDPVALAERGGLRLDKGDLLGSVDDLRKALGNAPPAETGARAREKLYEALTELLQRDFNAAEPFLKDYEPLCAVNPMDAVAEGPRRRVTFLVLVGRGREGQGKLLDALKAYLDLAALGGGDLVPVLGQPGLEVRLDVWARGRIDQLLRKAGAAERKRLEEEIDRRRRGAGRGQGPAGLRAFVAAISPASAAGRAARLELARRLTEAGPAGDREADLLLQEVRRRHDDPARAAEAVEALARLCAPRSPGRRRLLLPNPGPRLPQDRPARRQDRPGSLRGPPDGQALRALLGRRPALAVRQDEGRRGARGLCRGGMGVHVRPRGRAAAVFP